MDKAFNNNNLQVESLQNDFFNYKAQTKFVNLCHLMGFKNDNLENIKLMHYRHIYDMNGPIDTKPGNERLILMQKEPFIFYVATVMRFSGDITVDKYTPKSGALCDKVVYCKENISKGSNRNRVDLDLWNATIDDLVDIIKNDDLKWTNDTKDVLLLKNKIEKSNHHYGIEITTLLDSLILDSKIGNITKKENKNIKI